MLRESLYRICFLLCCWTHELPGLTCNVLGNWLVHISTEARLYVLDVVITTIWTTVSFSTWHGYGVTAWHERATPDFRFQILLPACYLSVCLSALSQVRLGRNDTKPPAPGLEDVLCLHSMVSIWWPHTIALCSNRCYAHKSVLSDRLMSQWREQSNPNTFPLLQRQTAGLDAAQKALIQRFSYTFL